MATENKNWAAEYLLDPLTAPDPNNETGPGSSFRQRDEDRRHPRSTNPPQEKQSPSVSVKAESTGGSTNPYHRSTPSSSLYRSNGSVSSRGDLGSLPAYRSSRPSADYVRDAFPPLESTPNRARSAGRHEIPPSGKSGRPRRASSLSQRYPGDKTNQPLQMLERDNKLANRSPHLKKRHQPKADSIDQLDGSLGAYHHGGPYDATLLVRNSSYESSPVAAAMGTNTKALRATPADKIKDSLNDHRPLEGTSIYPPGVKDPLGNVLHYEEGENMMTANGGDYKRWPGIQYHPDDIKGKGEPSYTIEKHLKESRANDYGGEGEDVELAERPKHSGKSRSSPRRSDGEDASATATGGQRYSDWERNNTKSHARNISGELKRRIGSLKRK